MHRFLYVFSELVEIFHMCELESFGIKINLLSNSFSHELLKLPSYAAGWTVNILLIGSLVTWRIKILQVIIQWHRA